jgi:hypothetical protein
MRKCLECGTEVDGDTSICPECGRVADPFDRPPFPRQEPISDEAAEASAEQWKARRAEAAFATTLLCVRCQRPLAHRDTTAFEVRSGWEGLGTLMEGLVEKRHRFDIYACDRCGKVEFFLADVGKSLRGG